MVNATYFSLLWNPDFSLFFPVSFANPQLNFIGESAVITFYNLKMGLVFKACLAFLDGVYF